MNGTWDTIIVGAGPAGLTAAMYLARFRRSVLVLHDGGSRALRIPKTHNAPGFPDGIAGLELIERMTTHAEEYGAQLEEAEVASATHSASGFRLEGSDGRIWVSRSLVLATGIRLNQVDLPHEAHEAAIRAGILRYCPICDGFEHIDKRIAVLGCDTNGAAEALFLRRYSRDITLLPRNFPDLSKDELSQLGEAGIAVEFGHVEAFEPSDRCMGIRLEGRSEPLIFDVLYPALGVTPRNELATDLGVPVNDHGCSPEDAPKVTNVAGLFIAGDVVEGLDQISVAMGHGAVAATRAHNWLRDIERASLQK
jgi:thioredoxin reductase (NADPH)